MKYALLIYTATQSMDGLSAEEQESITAEYAAVTQDPGIRGASSSSRSTPPPRLRRRPRQPHPSPACRRHQRDPCCFTTESADHQRHRRLAVLIPRRRWLLTQGANVEAAVLIEQVFREEWGRVLASLIGFLGDFDLAEDAASGGLRDRGRALAARRDPRTTRAPGWSTTARHRAIDRIRRERTLAHKTRLLGRAPRRMEDETVDDDGDRRRAARADLHLLPSGARARSAGGADAPALGGLTTEEIARAFLVPEETMKRRLSRAKREDQGRRDPVPVPADHLLPDRLDAVLAVVYLIFNEGYSGRVDLAAEAIRLGRVLAALMPDEPEVYGLLALMLLHHARRGARFARRRAGAARRPGPLAVGRGEIAAGRQLLTGRSRCAGAAPTSLQAAIASLQTETEIDWAADRRAVRRARPAHGLAGGRAQPGGRDRRGAVRHRAGDRRALDLDDYQYLHSTRAELLRRLGRAAEERARTDAPLELAHPGPSAAFSSAGSPRSEPWGRRLIRARRDQLADDVDDQLDVLALGPPADDRRA